MPSKGTFGWNICLEPFLGCFLLSTLELYKPHEWASGFRFGQVNLSWGMCERNVAELIPYSYSSSYSPELCKKNATALTTLELTPRHGAVRQRPEGLLLLLMPLGHTAAVRIAVLQHSLNPTSEWSSVHWPSVTETAPPHCTVLHFTELRIARRRCRVSGRHCCLPRLLPLSPPRGGGCSRDQAEANHTPGSSFYSSIFLTSLLLVELATFN